MKRIAMIMVLLLMFAFTASAQDDSPITGLTAKGIKAGLNIAGHTGDDTDEFHKNLVAFAFGGFLTFSMSDQIAIQPELLYNMKGSEWEDPSGTWKGKYNYLEMPVLIKYLIPTEGNFKPNIFIGPSIGILLSAEEDWKDTMGTMTEDVKDQLKNTDFGLAFGLGGSFAMGDGSLIFEGRYTVGMTKIYEDHPDLGELDIKSKLISFFVGYGF